MTEKKREGGCQCGEVRYEISGEPIFAAICHCSMCRRANAAPAVAWAMFHESQLRFSKGEVKTYASSSEAQRGFCERCGTQISFTATFLPELIDVTIGSLDDPESVQPTLHYWHSNHLSWVEFSDNLPRHPELPPFS
ncbi:GFA family protein [Noviherbaspirillum cavernae]|uniref:GFA family protein n=1 Tax=Noviherbaspirillum cavernae TaxID=2320862 RepID=A0A418WZ83_9BURK|nr:GFA family protein [Noviherbaspirillum cavernae]RJG05548.1 GFA family protein [Noviherbaspirillum cavernae]